MAEYRPLVTVRKEKVDGLGPWVWVESDNGAWDGPKKDWETSHKDKYFEHVRKFDVVVQAGGNQGMYPRLLARKFKIVYTFEPDPLNFYCLVQNCQEDNIIKMQAALGKEHELVLVDRKSMNNVGMHTVTSGGSIPTIKVDDLALPHLDLLLLDVEGYEFNILQGAADSIEKYKPVVVCERGDAQCSSFLAEYGYVETGKSVEDSIYTIL